MTAYRGIRVRRGATLPERLAFHSRPGPNGCVVWTGSTDGRAGYGKLRWQGRMQYVHRLAWTVAHGEDPPADREVRHRCDNPPCLAAAHLELGTHLENVGDTHARGRASDRRGEANNAARLTAALVSEIRSLHAGGLTGRAVAKQFGVSESQISNIVNNHQWKESA